MGTERIVRLYMKYPSVNSRYLICVALKVAAVALIRRHTLWEAGPGPGGSSLTSRGKTYLISLQKK